MKHFLGTLVALCLVAITNAQYSIEGRVTQKNSQALESATVTLLKNGSVINTTLSDANGHYTFNGIRKKGDYTVSAGYISMQKELVNVTIDAGIAQADISLQPYTYFLSR